MNLQTRQTKIFQARINIYILFGSVHIQNEYLNSIKNRVEDSDQGQDDNTSVAKKKDETEIGSEGKTKM